MSGKVVTVIPYKSCGEYKFGMSLSDAKGLSSGRCFETKLENGGVALQYDTQTLVFSKMDQLEEVVIPEGCDLRVDGISIFLPSKDVLPALGKKFGSPEEKMGDLFFRDAGLILTEFTETDECERSVGVCSMNYFERVLNM